MIKLLAIGLLAYVLPMLMWMTFMISSGNNVLSEKNQDWGAFGSFVGGIAGPVAGLLSVAFLYLTITSNNKNHERQLKLLQSQNRKDHLIKLIEIYHQKLDEEVSEQWFLISNINQGNPIKVYEDQSTYRDFPSGKVRHAICTFALTKKPGLKITSKYHELIRSICVNAELCVTRIFEYILETENQEDFEDALNIFEAMAETHSTHSLLELTMQSCVDNETHPTLERLEDINKRSPNGLYPHISQRYTKIKDIWSETPPG